VAGLWSRGTQALLRQISAQFLSDFAIHSTAAIIGEVDSDVVKDASTGQSPWIARAGAAGAIAGCLRRAFFRTLCDIDPLAKLAAKK
jgi:hypothetical protein